MPGFLKLSTLGLTAACAFTLTLTPWARAQQDARPDTTSFTWSALLSFTGASGAAPGQAPEWGNLVQASDGNFYGTTYEGGANGDGALYKFTPAGVATLLHSFNGSDGSVVLGGLVQGTDGNFYGTASTGGAHGDGTIYQVTSGGSFTLLYSFSGTADGNAPSCQLVQGTDGNFYGTAFSGGANNDGTVYKITPGGTLTLLHSFAGTADGKNPDAGLVQGSDGNFYGMASAGGAYNDGSIFQITPGDTFTLLHSFTGMTRTSDGATPVGALVQGVDGNFYGTTTLQGNNLAGTFFNITPGGTFTLLHQFNGVPNDAKTSYGALTLASDGNFYNAGYMGGANNYGEVYQMTPAGVATMLYSFSATGSADRNPATGLVQGMDGNLYGTFFKGGASSDGGVYKMTASPTLPAPVQLTAPGSSVNTGASFTLSYLVTNATSDTMKQCFATNNAGDTTGWAGIKTAATTSNSATLTASSTAGTYTYALTCGGMETGTASVTVVAPPEIITFTSVAHNFGSSTVGTAAPAYGVTIKNTGTLAYPFSLVFTPANGFTSATNCGSSIAAGATCQLVFYFTPDAAGTVSASWSLAPEGSFTYSPSNGGTLTGSGTAAGNSVTLTTSGHNFGSVTVGTTSPIYGLVMANTTSATVSLTYTTVTSPFLVSGSNCGATLAAGASCNLQFEFQPTATGITQQVYGIQANGGAVPVTTGMPETTVTGVTLTGTGQ